MEFKDKVKQLRQERNLTQEELAQKLFVSRQAVSKWEQGRGLPDIESLKRLSALCEISIDDLLSNEETKLLAVQGTAGLRRNRTLNIVALCLSGVFLLCAVIGLAVGFRPKAWGETVEYYYGEVTAVNATENSISMIDRNSNVAYGQVTVSAATSLYEEDGTAMTLSMLTAGDYVTVTYCDGKPEKRVLKIVRTDRALTENHRGVFITAGQAPPLDLDLAMREQSVAAVLYRETERGGFVDTTRHYAAFSITRGDNSMEYGFTIYADPQKVLAAGGLSVFRVNEDGTSPLERYIDALTWSSASAVAFDVEARSALWGPRDPGRIAMTVQYHIRVEAVKAPVLHDLRIYNAENNEIAHNRITKIEEANALQTPQGAAYMVCRTEYSDGTFEVRTVAKDETLRLLFSTPDAFLLPRNVWI